MIAVNFVDAMNGLGQYLFNFSAVMPDEDDDVVEGDWSDEEDEDFDDQFNDPDDLNEVRVGDDLLEPDPDADHLPNDDLQ